MTTQNKKHNYRTDALLCAAFILLIAFGNQIDMLLGGVDYLLSGIFILALAITIIIRFVRKLIIWIRNRTKPNFLPVAVYLIAILISFIVPDAELFAAKPVITAYYGGTQNQAFITFRENRKFELQWSGVFGYNKWFVGKYERKRDTLFLTYRNDNKPARFGTKILITKGELLSLDKPKDSTMYFCPFKIR